MEVTAVLAVLAIGVAVALPAASLIRDRGKTQAGARYLATLFAARRWTAVAQSRSEGLHFVFAEGEWGWREVFDGNGNGLRTVEIGSGVDRYGSPRTLLDDRVQGVHVGLLPDRWVPEAPPGRDLLPPGGDPVRFGRSDIVSFAPDGRASSGTLYVTDGRRELWAVVLFGPTARTRVWRWREDLGRWTR